MRNGHLRTLDFEPNKVNVITGDSLTGKTAILHIIDYCFFASKPRIPDAEINQHTEWFGIQFQLNDKTYTIARKSPERGKPSSDYYFSSTGKVPNTLKPNNSEKTIKPIIEPEFSIDTNVTFPFGGGVLKQGSKISLRYFMMFNTISESIIENSDGIFFDKQNEARYKEALPRIFDLALGIETVENILKKEKRTELESALKRLDAKQHRVADKQSEFHNDLVSLVRKAKEFSLIERSLDTDNSIITLSQMVSDKQGKSAQTVDMLKLQKEKYLLERKIKNLQTFKVQYQNYKNNLKNSEDSLKPIKYLLEHHEDIIKTSIFEELIKELDSDLHKIKNAVKGKTPIDSQVDDLIADDSSRLFVINKSLETMTENQGVFESDNQRSFFLGETKAKLELYYAPQESNISKSNNFQREKLKTQISSLDVEDVEDKKKSTEDLIQEIVAGYMRKEDVKIVLGNYAEYHPMFRYSTKSLSLRKPETTFMETVGSSSNHMFLHLFFSLSMHEVIIKNSSPFVAPFLVIDQPSRPYYGSGKQKKAKIDHSDEHKIKTAFQLLNDFIERRNQKDESFQMIVFEHVPESTWDGMKNIHLVEIFKEPNALINLSSDSPS